MNARSAIHKGNYREVLVSSWHKNAIEHQNEYELEEFTDADYRSIFFPCLLPPKEAPNDEVDRLPQDGRDVPTADAQ
jgi:hypothetical protein